MQMVSAGVINWLDGVLGGGLSGNLPRTRRRFPRPGLGGLQTWRGRYLARCLLFCGTRRCLGLPPYL